MTMNPPEGYTARPIWDDQFAGTELDTTKWTPMLAGQGGSHWNSEGLPAGFSATGSTGQTVYDPAHVVVNDGLCIVMGYDNTYESLGYHTRGGAICTFDKFTFQSGYVQVRAKMPDCSQGQWPAVWLLPNTNTGGSEEIDIHEGGMWPGGYGYSKTCPLNEAFCPNWHEPNGDQPLVLSDTTPVVPDLTNWHVYGMELKSGKSVKFYMDGVLYAQTTVNVPTADKWELIINLAEVASGVGLWHQPCPTNISTLPGSILSVAEVQVYALP